MMNMNDKKTVTNKTNCVNKTHVLFVLHYVRYHYTWQKLLLSQTVNKLPDPFHIYRLYFLAACVLFYAHLFISRMFTNEQRLVPPESSSHLSSKSVLQKMLDNFYLSNWNTCSHTCGV